MDWQNDAKHYEFWVRADANGHFTIPNVRPGTYTLHAIADGVLGDFSLTNVTIAAGQTLKLGKLNWQPVRHGRQLWDIGIPNRNGSEFFKGADYYHWGWHLEYAKRFTNDVNYVVGRSDFHQDWFFEQVPHNEDPENTDGRGRGRDTTWAITFNPPDAPRGQATQKILSESPCLQYKIWVEHPGDWNFTVRSLPTFSAKTGQPQRYAIALDDEPPQIVSLPVSQSETNRLWQENVLRNAALTTNVHAIAQSGLHTLKIWMVDPGLVWTPLLAMAAGWRGWVILGPWKLGIQTNEKNSCSYLARHGGGWDAGCRAGGTCPGYRVLRRKLAVSES